MCFCIDYICTYIITALFTFQVEGLLDEQDFKLQVTREDFETLCSDLFDRVKGPIDQALKSSGLTLDVINHVSIKSWYTFIVNYSHWLLYLSV